MSNKYGIPDEIERTIRERDKVCIYCNKEMKEHLHAKGAPADKTTIEHIEDVKSPTIAQVGICCGACNSSRGAKELTDWFETKYCKEKNINRNTVADVVRQYLNSKRTLT
jgi:hypothetical protein